MEGDTRWRSHVRYPYLLAKYVGAALLFLLVIGLLYRLRIVMIPILFGGVLAFLLTPAVDFLCRHRWPRALASGFMVFVAVLVIALLAFLVIPTLIAQMSEIVMQIPVLLDLVDQRVMPWVRDELKLSVSLDRTTVTRFVESHFRELASPSGWLLSKAFASAFNLVLALLNTLIVIVFTFYLLRAWHDIISKARDLIPDRFREGVAASMNAVEEALSAFVRGQLIVCCILAMVYSVALSIIGVNGGAVIGILAGLLGFVPYLGLTVGLLLSLLSIALAYAGFGQILAVAILFTAVPALDTAFITPNVVGGKTGLNPFLVIVALLVGAELLGFLGLLLAVPTAAILRALLRVWIHSYRESRFYLGEDAESSDRPQPPEQSSSQAK